MALLFLALSFGTSALVSTLMIKAGIGDHPDHRSSHKTVTPTGGGLGIVAAIGVVSLFLTQVPGIEMPSGRFAQMLSLIFAVSFLGLMDDIFDLAAGFKLLFLLAISIAAIWAIGPVTHLPFGGVLNELPPWLSWGGSVLWVFTVMNLVNFMDGSNGLMVTVMGFACFFLAYSASILGVTEPFFLLAMSTFAIIGLAVFNARRKALIFSGDVGSLTLGFIFAVSALWINHETKIGSPIYLGPVLIMPFLLDGLYTLYMRALQRKNLLKAHQDHLYQGMIRKGVSHMTVALVYGLVTVILGMYSIAIIQRGLFHFINYPVFPALIFTLGYLFLRRRFS